MVVGALLEFHQVGEQMAVAFSGIAHCCVGNTLAVLSCELTNPNALNYAAPIFFPWDGIHKSGSGDKW